MHSIMGRANWALHMQKLCQPIAASNKQQVTAVKDGSAHNV